MAFSSNLNTCASLPLITKDIHCVAFTAFCRFILRLRALEVRELPIPLQARLRMTLLLNTCCLSCREKFR